ncbi:TPA: hypothetical protein TVL50_000855 [Streptococcus equi subsp. zooepidemicus]|nr:hypothetical protein [Streptococcus equi]MCD3464826.1 hypothetical protein [Streptococcus equi subsp. zooepidemicus]HEL1205279.1 hypothetical protein [Streptococcus equi subsp. zooepidemicus]
MYKENDFNCFVMNRSNLNMMIDMITKLIPDREFYYPEIRQGSLLDYQKDIYDLIKIGYCGVKEVRSDYSKELEQLVLLKRKLLKFGLLMQPLEKQQEIVIDLARRYRLHKQLLRRRELFRDDECE